MSHESRIEDLLQSEAVKPQSRVEDILTAKNENKPYTKLPQSRVEKLLLQLQINGGGIGSGTDISETKVLSKSEFDELGVYDSTILYVVIDQFSGADSDYYISLIYQGTNKLYDRATSELSFVIENTIPYTTLESDGSRAYYQLTDGKIYCVRNKLEGFPNEEG